MLKRTLLSRWSQQAEPGGEDDLREQQPHIEERATDDEADTERGELRRHAELRERTDRDEGGALTQEPLREPVLPAVERAVRAAEPRRIPRRRRISRHALDIEIDAQDGRQRDEARGCGDRPARVPPEPGEERSIDEEVALGVQIAAERRDATGQARKLAVRIVEDRLRLHEQRRND